MLISILVATFNRLSTTQKYLLNILENIGNIEHEVLIWDNGSTDGTFDWLLETKNYVPSIRDVFFSHENIGMEAFNYLAEEARGKYILKIDDDISVPGDFAGKLVRAFEELNEPKLAYLGYDMKWGNKTFAKRSGLDLYKRIGKVAHLSDRSTVYISYEPNRWMINGVCRLSLKETFLKLGGHPKGIRYGVDHYVSSQAQANGYWIGFYSSNSLIQHFGEDSSSYRSFKDQQLRLARAPKHV